MARISVLGLGDMGGALAQTLIDRGHDVTVWNRSPGRARRFRDAGVPVAESLDAAVAASDVIVTCTKTHVTTRALLDEAGAALAGRSVIELSTGDGPSARALTDRLSELGARAQIGMMLCGPAQIGQDGTAFLFAGPDGEWQAHQGIIRDLAPASDHIGGNVAHLADLFAALFLPRQGAMFGMIYGAHFAEVAGIPLDVYIRQLPAAMRVATELYVPTVADTIPADDYSGSGSPLKVYEHAFRDAFAAFRDRGADMALSDLFEGLIAEGMKAGYGDEHLTALIKVLRDRGG